MEISRNDIQSAAIAGKKHAMDFAKRRPLLATVMALSITAGVAGFGTQMAYTCKAGRLVWTPEFEQVMERDRMATSLFEKREYSEARKIQKEVYRDMGPKGGELENARNNAQKGFFAGMLGTIGILMGGIAALSGGRKETADETGASAQSGQGRNQ